MICSNCGTQIPDEKKRCPVCGAEIVYGNGPESSIEVKPRGFSNKRNIIIIVLAGLLMLGGAAAAVTITTVTHSASEIIKTAQRYLSEQNYEQAIIEFQRVLAIDPMNVDAYLGMAEAYIGLGDYDKAEEILRKGYELTGDAVLLDKINNLFNYNSGGDSKCLEIEEMIEAYLRGEGGIDNSKLKDVTGLTIYGTEVVAVECGSRIGTLLNGWSGYEDGGSIWTGHGEEFFSYGTIDSLHENIPFVYDMPSLVKLGICFNPLSDISEFTELDGLQDLTLHSDKFTDISGISEMNALTSLDLWEDISDISPLKSMTNLKELYIASNALEDISPISDMTWLEGLQLHIAYNQTLDASYLSSLNSLTSLQLFDNPIANASVIGNIDSLIDLHIINCNLGDYSFISRLRNLGTLQLADYVSEHIDLSFASALSSLQQLDIYSKINDISPFMELESITQLDITSSEFIPDEQIEQFKQLHPDCWVRINYSEDAAADTSNETYETVEAPVEFVEQTLSGNTELYDTVQMISAYLKGEGSIDKSKLNGINDLYIHAYDGVSIAKYNEDGSKGDGAEISTSAHCSGNIRNIEQDMSFIFDMPDLKILTLENQSLTEISSLSLDRLTNLKELHITEMKKLKRITELRGSESLEDIVISSCNSLREIGSISDMNSLRYLGIYDCRRLETISDFSGLPSLTSIYIIGNFSLTDISFISGAQNLGYVGLQDGRWQDISPISTLKKLQSLSLVDVSVNDISSLSDMEQLNDINFKCCIDLKDYSPLGRMKNLEYLDFDNCSIEAVPAFMPDSKLFRVNFNDCNNLYDVSDLAELSNIYHISIQGCDNVTEEKVEQLRNKLPYANIGYEP